MTAFPVLPVPQFNGITVIPLKRARRFEVDEGPAKQSMVTTAALFRVTIPYECTPAEMSAIMSFWADPAGGAGGGRFFPFTQPFTGATVNARFVVGSEPSGTGAAPHFNVTVTLEVDAW